MWPGILILLGPVLLFGAGLYWLYTHQEHLLFHPRQDHRPLPPAVAENVERTSFLTSDNLKLEAWWVPPPDDNMPVILFFHGNTGNLTYCGITAEKFLDLEAGIVFFDYRGYGQSEGKPTEEGLNLDAMAAWRWLTMEKGIRPERIILYGRSLGAAVAVRLAAEEGLACRSLVMESGFSSIGAVREDFYPLLPATFARYQFDSLEWIRKRRCPLLIAHSPQEDYIYFHHAQKLWQYAPFPKMFFPLQGGHNGGWVDSWPDYAPFLKKFIRDDFQALSPPPRTPEQYPSPLLLV